MQRVINYGSFLQAFALKNTLKELGHECYFIDIKVGRKITSEKINIKKGNNITFILDRLDKYFLGRVKHQYFKKKRFEKFYNEFFPILGISKMNNFDSNYDVVIIGSDEVFNCARETKWGFAKTLLGEGLNSNRVITYAASCGHTTLEKLSYFGIDSEVKAAMKNLDSVSVRDENTSEFVKALTDIKPVEHIDPVLIYDFTNMVPKTKAINNYILVYAYDNRINDKETINKIREIARKYKKKIISVGFYQNWVDKNILCNPFELLAYFRDADYIITDTFHGTVFSIKYNKQFGTIIRGSNKQKLGYLLTKFELKNQEVKNISDLERIINQKPDYDLVNSIINLETKKAIRYLEENLIMEE